MCNLNTLIQLKIVFNAEPYCVGKGESNHLLFQNTGRENRLEGKMKATQNDQDGQCPAHIFS
jgi:hypothetical protein